MGAFVNPTRLSGLGWTATLVVTLAAAGFAVIKLRG